MRRKTSGNTCARPISPTACSKTTPQSSTLASSHGVAFSTSSVASSPSPAVIGLLPVNHSEVWYKSSQLGHRRKNRLAAEEQLDIPSQQQSPLALHLRRESRDVWRHHHVRHGAQILRDHRLCFEDVERGTGDGTRAQCLDQGGRVDDAAAPDIDQKAVRSKRLENGCVDHVIGLRPPWCGDDQVTSPL